MTKKKSIGIILVITLVVFSYMKTKTSYVFKQTPAPKVAEALPTKSVVAPPTHHQNLVERTPANTGHVNQPSINWENKLKDSLRAQGGNSLKEIKIQKERSLIWTRDENPLHVESVIVTLKNQKDMESTFRALVDSQTGKVLESWDRTIVDYGQIKDDGYRLKLDPRYQ